MHGLIKGNIMAMSFWMQVLRNLTAFALDRMNKSEVVGQEWRRKILSAWPTTSTILAILIMKGYKITFSTVEIRKWDCVEGSEISECVICMVSLKNAPSLNGGLR